MANKRDADGVIGTIERLTGMVPCPEFLRTALNKYLECDAVFPGAVDRTGKKVRGTLQSPGTDALVVNVLELDQLFRGNTTLVARIVRGEVGAEELSEKLQAALAEYKRRADTYARWSDRETALRAALTGGSLNLREARLDIPRGAGAQLADAHGSSGFALRAIATLEESEERGRLARPTADEYVERADAYLALGDPVRADAHAVQALSVNKAHPRAWFIRVTIALQRRGLALQQMRHHEMIAQEAAEPLSSQERWAREMAGEASGRAATQQQKLAEILPKALVHWPTSGQRRFEQPEMRTQVRDLFIDLVFASATTGLHRHLKPQDLYRVNGLDAEWQLEVSTQPFLAMGTSGAESHPLNEGELQALEMLFREQEVASPWYFHPLDQSSLARELKLLHLRRIAGSEGYAGHWSAMKESVEAASADARERCILSSPTMARFWHLQFAHNEGEQGVFASLAKFESDRAASYGNACSARMLQQYALFFHQQFARKKYAVCSRICALAGVNAASMNRVAPGVPNLAHPYSDAIQMPIGVSLYWEYLSAVSAVYAIACGSYLQGDVELILDAERFLAAFKDTDACFWIESEEYEDGGGEDWPAAPYGADLRDVRIWKAALRRIVDEANADIRHELLDGLIARLEQRGDAGAPITGSLIEHLQDPHGGSVPAATMYVQWARSAGTSG